MKINNGHLAVELKENNKLIGTGGIVKRDVDGNKEFEIGYALKPKYWGNGYAQIDQTMKEFAIQKINAKRFISKTRC